MVVTWGQILKESHPKNFLHLWLYCNYLYRFMKTIWKLQEELYYVF